MIIKIAVNTTARRAILDIADIFRAKTVDVSDHTVTLQVIVMGYFYIHPPHWPLYLTDLWNYYNYQLDVRYWDRLEKISLV